jgi:hypothetical protein
MYIFLIKFWVIIISFCTAYILYYKIFKPYFFIPRGIVNTNRAVQIQYFLQGNTVLFSIIPSGIWAWYNGSDVYIYGHPIEQTCKDDSYEASYKLDSEASIPTLNYSCTTRISTLLSEYRKNKDNYIFHSSDNPSRFSVQDAMNLLLKYGIITR